ncbi:MAG: class I SAM-dependent methyltransferase [Chloroflexota bacterium]
MKIDRNTHYHNFGFIPNGDFPHDLYGKLFGHPNLMKRLQARDIIRALDIQPGDVVLDFGCGVGYFTVELAKLAKMTYGIDINPYIEQIDIPSSLKNNLKFIVVSGEQLPFDDNTFDRVLASEILPMVPDANFFLKEIYRVLKPEGKLVISNGTGHPVLREAFEKRSWFFRRLESKYSQRMPKSYEHYCEILQNSFGTSRKDFLQENDIRHLLEQNSFTVNSVTYTPGYLVGTYFSWLQFLMYLRTGQTLSQRRFAINFVFWNFISLFDKHCYKGGLLCDAQKNR